MTEQQLARGLLAGGLLTPQQVQAAAQQRAAGVSLAQALVDGGYVSTMDVLQVDPDAFAAAAAPSAARGRVAAVGPPPAPAVASPAATAPQPHANGRPGLGQSGGLVLDDSGVRISGEEDRGNDPVMGTIVTYCNELLRYAVTMRASDMHLEPQANGLLPRFRVDGQLRSGTLIAMELRAPICSRFKVLANLDITETRLPQDGRFRATIGGLIFDFRVSSLPSMHGEKIVIRILDRSALVTDLGRLGLNQEDQRVFENMVGQSQGLILVTGPTGSGKTTTLYAALAACRDETKNVVTVEDPVEYEMQGVTQTNVHSDIGLTFAAQLRAILRQDPDVILVGEIRDSETADMAIRAALTGHLVLSTLHTNSAVAAVTRMQDMNVPSFLIASSLAGVLAQRLVRMICAGCRQPLPQDSAKYQDQITRLKLPPGTNLYYGAGCSECNGSGTRGRLAIIELLTVQSQVRRAIMDKADASTLRDIAVRNGMRTLWQDGIDKLKRGLTTADEIVRALMGSEDETSDADF